MKTYVINPPFKAEYGKFSRESRSPAVTKSGALYYPLWLIYAAALLENEAGFEVEFLDAPAAPLNTEQSLETIGRNGEGTRLFVLGTSTPSISNDAAFGGMLKDRYPDSFVLLVGTHPSALPEQTLALDSRIDGVARREYDFIVRDLARALAEGGGLDGVLGLSYRSGGQIVHNADMPYIENLDVIPYAAQFIKERLNARDYFFAAASFPSIQIFAGRGCPCRCNYCVYPQVFHGHGYRLRSPRNVVGEFEYIAENFPDVREVVIEDDTFTVNKNRMSEICELLIEKGLNKRLKWLCNARVNLDLETMKLMKKAGCRLIIPGIESGNQQILDNVKKSTKIEQIHQYVADSKRAGLLVHACYMVGNRGETKDTMEQTLALALKLNTDTAQFFPLIPYPGTEAYEWASSNGYINSDFDSYCKEDGTHNCVIDIPGITAGELVDFCDAARKKYYLRPRYILHRVRMGLIDKNDLKRSLKAFKKLKKYLFKRAGSNS